MMVTALPSRGPTSTPSVANALLWRSSDPGLVGHHQLQRYVCVLMAVVVKSSRQIGSSWQDSTQQRTTSTRRSVSERLHKRCGSGGKIKCCRDVQKANVMSFEHTAHLKYFLIMNSARGLAEMQLAAS